MLRTDSTPHLAGAGAGAGVDGGSGKAQPGSPGQAASAPLHDDKCGVRDEDSALEAGLGWVFAASKMVPSATVVVTPTAAKVAFDRDDETVRNGERAWRCCRRCFRFPCWCLVEVSLFSLA